MKFDEFICAAKGLEGLGTNIRPIYRANDALTDEQVQRLLAVGAAVETAQPSVIFHCLKAGLTDVYFDCGEADDEALASLFGKCRFVAHKKAEIKQLDRITGPLLQPGHLETIAIRLQNSSDELAFTPNNISRFSGWIRFSDNLAVRGIFVDIEKEFSEQAKESYSLIKKIRCDMPCLFSYFCLSGLLEPLSKGDEALAQSLKMIDSLNDTSLYACFYIQ